MKRRLCPYAVLLALLVPAAACPQTFRISAKEQGYQLSDRYPTGDFQVQLRLNLSAAGSVLDTVGIDAAPAGSWNVVVGADGRIAFNLWDGRSWSQTLSNVALDWNRDTLVSVRRLSGTVMVMVQSGWVTSKMETPLSGKPVFVGDYPPDEHWGPGYNIHQAALGQIDVLYLGVPKLYPANFTDYASRIVDQIGATTAAERDSLAATLRILKEKKNIDMGAAFVAGEKAEDGYRAMDMIAHQLRMDGKLPLTYAILGHLQDKMRLFHRTSDFDKIISWDEILKIWDRQQSQSRAQNLVGTFAEMAGVAAPIPTVTPPTNPPVNPPVNPPTVTAEGKAEIGPSGGSVKAGSARVDIPAGAMMKPDTVAVQEGVPTMFGEAGVSVAFEHGDQLLMKPAQITVPIPAGSDPRDLIAARSLSPTCWVTMPLTVSGTTATFKTNHFCTTVILNLGRTTSKIGGSIAGGVGGTLLLAALGAAPATSGASVIVAIPLLAIGWFMGDAAYDAAQGAGLSGPLPVPGFSLYWDKAVVPSSPYLTFLVDGRTGTIISLIADSRKPTGPVLQPAGEARTKMTYTLGEREIEVDIKDVKDYQVPLSVIGAAGELMTARIYYESLGISTPQDTTVYVYGRLGKSKDQARETNSGEWDGKVLQLSAKSLSAEPPNSKDARSASCHEYWHAVVSHNGFREAWLGAEEATAVAMESLVWAAKPETPEAELLDDFLTLHAWTTCTPVLRSGLYRLGEGELAESRGYKQWPLVKYIYHKMGKEGYIQLIKGGFSDSRLDEALVGLALAGLVRDQVIADPTPIADHPLVPGGLSRTGFAKPSLIEDPSASKLIFGRNTVPKAVRGSINAFNVIVPARESGLPNCPIVLRRRETAKSAYPTMERVYAGKPGGTALPQPALADMKAGEYSLVLPDDWDTAGRMAVAFVGMVQGGKDDVSTGNDLFVYRLAPPTQVKAEHLPGGKPGEEVTRFRWNVPTFAGGLSVADTIGAYRLYGRKKGQAPELIAEFSLDADHPAGWFGGGTGAVKIPPDASKADVMIERTKALSFDEFAMSSVDGMAQRDGKPLESPIPWAGGSSFLAALAQCKSVNFMANLNFEGTWTHVYKDEPPRTETTVYPVSGAVNAPDYWGFGNMGLKGSKLTINGGHFELKFNGNLKDPNPTSAGGLMEALEGYNPAWPFNSGSAFDGATDVSMVGDITADGRLTKVQIVITHGLFGCTISLADMVPKVAVLEGAIRIQYSAENADATAKVSNVSGWMRWNNQTGYSEFRISKYMSARAISLAFAK